MRRSGPLLSMLRRRRGPPPAITRRTRFRAELRSARFHRCRRSPCRPIVPRDHRCRRAGLHRRRPRYTRRRRRTSRERRSERGLATISIEEPRCLPLITHGLLLDADPLPTLRRLRASRRGRRSFELFLPCAQSWRRRAKTLQMAMNRFCSGPIARSTFCDDC